MRSRVSSAVVVLSAIGVVGAAGVVSGCVGSAGSPGAQELGGRAEAHLDARSTECGTPRRILQSASPFQKALETWGRDAAAGAAELERACVAAADDPLRGTEHAACSAFGLILASGEGVPRNPQRAFRFLERGAKCGFSFHAQELVQAEAHGIGGESVGCCSARGCEAGCEADCAKAMDMVTRGIAGPLERACQAGRGVACYMLADAVRGEYVAMVGHFQLPSSSSEEALLEKACTLGVGPACEHLAYLDLASEQQDLPRRARYLTKACDAGWGDGCLAIGKSLAADGKRRDAIPFWEKACKLGLTTVCTDLRDILVKGKGVPADPARAAAIDAEAWKID